LHLDLVAPITVCIGALEPAPYHTSIRKKPRDWIPPLITVISTRTFPYSTYNCTGSSLHLHGLVACVFSLGFLAVPVVRPRANTHSAPGILLAGRPHDLILCNSSIRFVGYYSTRSSSLEDGEMAPERSASTADALFAEPCTAFAQVSDRGHQIVGQAQASVFGILSPSRARGSRRRALRSRRGLAARAQPGENERAAV
jgi:hypothetical protein